MPKFLIGIFVLLLTGCSNRSYTVYDASNSTPPPVEGITAVNVQLSDNEDVDSTMQIENEFDAEESIVTYVDY